LPIIAWTWWRRRAAGTLVSGETPLVVGAFALFGLFLVWLPFDVARVALAVQLQISRLFWLLDFFATVYLVWWLGEAGRDGGQAPRHAAGADASPPSGPGVSRPSLLRPATVALTLALLSLARGAYTTFVQFPDRRLFAVDVQHDDWRDAMAFARTTDPRSGWIADPMHAAKYGSSLRAVGYRDVLIEPLKDHAIAIYDRTTAMRVADREKALSVLPWDTADGARALARRYGLDYLVVDHPLDLRLAHQAGSLFIYTLR
jgi:hypothetical protein